MLVASIAFTDESCKRGQIDPLGFIVNVAFLATHEALFHDGLHVSKAEKVVLIGCPESLPW